ncbi:MAG: lysophospholipid acyltransferase family protein [Gammaproteobacteria bacterium]
MVIVRSLVFSFGWAILTVVFGVASLFTVMLPFTYRYRIISQWSRMTLRWLKISCGLDYQVEGREHIPQGNAIIFCKHQSTWETLVLQEIFPIQVWVLKRELLWIPFFGWGLALLRPIAINRKEGRKAMMQLLEQGIERLRQGLWVVIFPEGTRVAPGQRGQYHKGGAMLAQRSGVPVVPVAHNAGEFWPRHSIRKYPGTIRVVIGPPIATEGRTAAEINRLAEEWIEGTMRTISAGTTEPIPEEG